jgi:hypothetical protein
MTLYTIDPAELAKEVADAVIGHIHHVAFSVGLTCQPMGPCDLEFSVRVLAHYAIHGGELDAPVQEYLISMLPIWSRASDGPSVTTPEYDDPDTVDATRWLGQRVLVMRAAEGRERIDAGQDVGPAELAILGGVSSRHVRHLLRSGEIKGKDDGRRWSVAATEARRWLATRVPS